MLSKMLIDSLVDVLLRLGSETARHKQCLLDFWPSLRRQLGDDRTEFASLDEGNVIKIERTSGGHPIITRENHLGCKSANRPCCWYND